MRPAPHRKLKKWVKADDHSKGQTNRRFKAAKSSNGRKRCFAATFRMTF